jgi:uncharacterized protein (TIGR03067 family)
MMRLPPGTRVRQTEEIELMPSRRAWMEAALAFTALVATGAGTNPGLRADEPKVEGDLKKLQGKWTAPAGDGGKVTYTFKGKTLKVEAPSRSYEMTVTLDDAAKPDKTIDFKIDEAPDDAKGKTCKGIYKLDGDDKMTFCFKPEGDRPTKYEMVGYEQIVIELTRAK